MGGVCAQTAAEYQLKAAFLFNFVQFAHWPENAFDDNESPLVIGVLGHDPFGDSLDELVRGEVVNGRALRVVRFADPKDVRECHLLFIGEQDDARLGALLENIRTRPILTVGEGDTFLAHGGVIQFFTQNNRIRLRINLDAATTAQVTLSSKLLRPAQVVRSGAG
jgi:hypothetical protein